MIVPAVLFAFTGLLLVGVSLPMMRRRVPPNSLYGLRVPATFADEWVWYEANARSGRDMALFGGLFVLAVLLLPLVPGLTPELYTAACAALLTGGVIACAAVGWRRANRLLAERRGSG
jgi:uncharacterized membrane protein